MLRREPGVKNFNRCPHKTVGLERVVISGDVLIVGAQLDCPTTQDEGLTIDARATGVAFGDRLKKGVELVTLTNLKTHEYIGNETRYIDQTVARNHLARVAGSIACDNCPYSRMTPLEVAQQRAEIAEERRNLAFLERDRLVNEALRRQAQDEIAALDTGIHPQID